MSKKGNSKSLAVTFKLPFLLSLAGLLSFIRDSYLAHIFMKCFGNHNQSI